MILQYLPVIFDFKDPRLRDGWNRFYSIRPLYELNIAFNDQYRGIVNIISHYLTINFFCVQEMPLCNFHRAYFWQSMKVMRKIIIV